MLFKKAREYSTKGNQSSLFQNFAMVSLLTVFSIFQFAQSLHIELSDDEHHQAHCTEEDEFDKCHVSIVHGEEQNGCKHPLHITKVESDCQLCDILAERFEIEIQPQEFYLSQLLQISDFTAKHNPYVFSKSLCTNPHRGPPSV
ncbi:MAG: hypothetical protein JXR07_17340 [Reichenbachiella sp.]